MKNLTPFLNIKTINKMLLQTTNTLQNIAAEYLDFNLAEMKKAIESTSLTPETQGNMCEMAQILSELLVHYVRDIREIENRNNPEVEKVSENTRRNRHHVDMIDKLKLIKLISLL
jgi:hypothetical protein